MSLSKKGILESFKGKAQGGNHSFNTSAGQLCTRHCALGIEQLKEKMAVSKTDFFTQEMKQSIMAQSSCEDQGVFK